MKRNFRSMISLILCLMLVCSNIVLPQAFAAQEDDALPSGVEDSAQLQEQPGTPDATVDLAEDKSDEDEPAKGEEEPVVEDQETPEPTEEENPPEDENGENPSSESEIPPEEEETSDINEEAPIEDTLYSELYAIARDNLALNKTVWVSKTENDDYIPSQAVDGKTNTRWATGGWKDTDADKAGWQDDQWLVVDLGQEQTFNTFAIYWEAAHASVYEIQTTSTTEDVADAAEITWNDTVYEQKNCTGGEEYIVLKAPVTSRYIRLHMTETKSEWGSSVWEFQVYNRDAQFYFDKAIKDLEAWNIPQYPTANFTVPTELLGDNTNQGSPVIKVDWTSKNSALTVGTAAEGEREITVTIPQDTEVAGDLEATIQYADETPIKKAFPITVKPTSGQLVNYSIYPIPQSIRYGAGHNPKITETVTVVSKNAAIGDVTKARVREVFENNGFDVEFANEPDSANSNIILDLYNGTAYPEYTNTVLNDDEGGEIGYENVYDAHAISIMQNAQGNAEFRVVGKHNEAVYYALASLEQILEQRRADASGNQTVSTVEILDYAHSKYRGVIEGFYGYAYSKADIKSLLDFGKRYKMNTFMYGPKADPYHLGNWRDPYPTEITEEQRRNGMLTQGDIREIAAKAKADGIDFVWTVHPMMQGGVDITTATGVEQGVQDILEKYEMMYDLGVRHFGLFVDDISVGLAVDNSENQAKLIGDVTAEWKEKHPDEFKPLFYVPTLYSFDAVKEEEKRLRNFGALAKLENLDDIIVTFTGTGVWSPIENDEMERMATYLDNRQKPMFWWNSPVNDNMDANMFLGPLDQRYAISNEVTDAVGMMTNPLSQAEASKISLFGMLDYSWNTAKFDVMENWEESFTQLIPDDDVLREAFSLFAANSAPNAIIGNKTSVVYSDVEDLVKALKAADGKTEQNMRALMNSMQSWKDACAYLESHLQGNANVRYAKLYDELAPWITKSHDVAELMIQCLKVALGETTELASFYDIVYRNAAFAVEPQYKVTSLEDAGINVYPQEQEVMVGGNTLMNFLPTAMGWAKENVAGSIPSAPADIVPTLLREGGTGGSPALSQPLDNGFEITGLSGLTLKEGEFVGASFPELADFKDLDALAAALPSGVTLQYSTNGKSWITYTNSAASSQKSALRFVNKSTNEVTFTQDKLTIHVKLVTPSKVKEVTNSGRGSYQSNPLSNLADGNWSTSYWANGTPQVGEWFQVAYEKPFVLQNLLLAFENGDNLDEKALLEISEDGENWTALGILNEDIVSEIRNIEGQDYQVFELTEIGKLAGYVRWTITEVPQGYSRYMRCYEVQANIGMVAPVISTSSGKGATMLLDGDPATAYVPTEADSLTYMLLAPQKIESLLVYMKPSAALPTAQVQASGVWHNVEMKQQGMEFRYVLDTSDLKAVSALRLSWDNQNRPSALYDIAYTVSNTSDHVDLSTNNQDDDSSGGSNSGSSGGSSGGSGGSSTSNTEKPTSTTTTDGANKVTTVTDSKTGDTTTTVSAEDGSESKTTVSKDGTVVSEITLSQKAIENSKNAVLKLPVSGIQVSSGNPSVTVKITLPEGTDAIRVAIPVANLTTGIVPALVKTDGTEEIVKKSIMENGALVIPMNGSATYKLMDNHKSFTDVINTHWASSAVQFAASRELFQGTGENTFSPDASMTRAMLVTVLYRLENTPPAENASFADVKEGEYYTNAVAWASSQKIVTGTGSGFEPNGNITREQLVAMLYRYAGSPSITGDLGSFADTANVSDWAKAPMAWAVTQGIISGTDNNRLAPAANATRAEVATILQRYISKM